MRKIHFNNAICVETYISILMCHCPNCADTMTAREYAREYICIVGYFTFYISKVQNLSQFVRYSRFLNPKHALNIILGGIIKRKKHHLAQNDFYI